MSNFFVDKNDLVRITFEDGPLAGNHMMVRAELSHVEKQRLALSNIGAEVTETGGIKPVLEGNALSDMDSAKLEAWIKAWTLPKKAGQQVGPEWRPTLGDFECLPSRIMQPILAKLAAHEASLEEEGTVEEGPLGSSSLTPTTPPVSDGMTAEPSGSTIS